MNCKQTYNGASSEPPPSESSSLSSRGRLLFDMGSCIGRSCASGCRFFQKINVEKYSLARTSRQPHIQHHRQNDIMAPKRKHEESGAQEAVHESRQFQVYGNTSKPAKK